MATGIVAAVLLGARGIAQAQAAAPTQSFADAKRLHEAGRRAEQQGDWRTACEQYRASVERAERPANLFKVGVCLRREQRYVDSWSTLQKARLLDRGDAATSKPDFEAEIEQELELVPTLRVDLPTDPMAWTITINDSPLEHDAIGRLRPVNLGEYLVRAEAPGYEPVVLRIVVERQDRYTATIPIQRIQSATLPQVSQQPGAAIGSPTILRAREPRSKPQVPKATRNSPGAQLVVGGAGLLTSVLGIVLRVDGQNDYDKAKSTCNNAKCDKSTAVELGNAARSRMLVGTIVGSVGLTAMAGAGIWWVLTPNSGTTTLPTRATLPALGIWTLPDGAWAGIRGEL